MPAAAGAHFGAAAALECLLELQLQQQGRPYLLQRLGFRVKGLGFRVCVAGEFKMNSVPVGYKNVTFHRVLKGFMVHVRCCCCCLCCCCCCFCCCCSLGCCCCGACWCWWISCIGWCCLSGISSLLASAGRRLSHYLSLLLLLPLLVLLLLLLQGGDFVKGDGSGSMSIYGSSFPLESAAMPETIQGLSGAAATAAAAKAIAAGCVPHFRAGLLCMANSAAASSKQQQQQQQEQQQRSGTNGCQFFITCGPCLWLDGRNDVFGQVIGRDSYQVQTPAAAAAAAANANAVAPGANVVAVPAPHAVVDVAGGAVAAAAASVACGVWGYLSNNHS